MFCIHCGKEISDDALFCIFCGQPTGNAQAPQAPQAPVPGPEAPKSESVSDKHRNHRGSRENAPAVEPAAYWQEQPPVRPAGEPPRAWPGGSYPDQAGPSDPFGGQGAYPGNNVPGAPVYPGPQNEAPVPGQRPGSRRSGRKKSGGLLPVVLLGAAGVLLIAGLAFLVMHLVSVSKDMSRIETVETCTLGEYETGMKDLLFGYYGERGYDTVTWEGAYVGFMKRGVQLGLSSKENGDLPDVRFRYEVRGPYCRVRAVDAGSGWNNIDKEIALYLNSICYSREAAGMSAEQEIPYLEKLDGFSSQAVLYGAPEGFAGERASLAKVFGEKTSSLTVLESLDLTGRLKALKQGEPVPAPVQPGTAETDAPSQTRAPEAPAPTAQAPAGPRVEAGTWTVEDPDRRLVLTVEKDETGGNLDTASYAFRMMQGNADGSTTVLTFTGIWDEGRQAVVYSDGAQTWRVKINGTTEDILILDGATGAVAPRDDGSLVWKPENPGQNKASGEILPQNETVFVSGDRSWETVTAKTSVSRQTPAQLDGRIPVVSARASSTIQQEKVSNDPILMFDGNDETSWQEGVDGYGIGESASFTLDGTYGLTALSFKLGNWRNQNYYETNAMPRKITVILGDERFQVEFENEKAVQWVTFSCPVYVDSVTILIDDVYKGTKYDDTCINEITPYGRKIR